METRPFTITWKYLIARFAYYKPLFFLIGAELRQKIPTSNDDAAVWERKMIYQTMSSKTALLVH